MLLKAQSFQLRNNNFSKNYKKNIVFKIGTPRRLHKLNGTLLSLLTGGGGNNNFFHWMFDVLPKLAIVEKHYNLKNINYYLCPDLNKWQLQSLNLIGIKKEQCLSSVKYTIHRRNTGRASPEGCRGARAANGWSVDRH